MCNFNWLHDNLLTKPPIVAIDPIEQIFSQVYSLQKVDTYMCDK